MTSIIRAMLVTITLALAACGSKVNPENYGKIENGMTRDQVYSAIGKPTEVSSAGIGNLTASNETWRGDDHTISITFANDKVRFKSMSSNSAEKPQN